MQLKIKKPNDAQEYYTTTIRCNTFTFAEEHTLSYDRSAKDPIQKSIEDYWRSVLSTRRKSQGYYYSRRNFGERFNHVVFINECPVLLVREGIRYQLNGKSYSLGTICSALARLTYKSCFENSPEVLLSHLYSTLNLPENVKYCMENRAPFHFYDDYAKIDVRLNVVQIDDKLLAMEISDGIWGEITSQQLDTYCNFYVHGKSRGSWKRLSPESLYSRLMGKKPSSSELAVMIAFLKQNRMQDIVDERAMQLVRDMVIQHRGRLIPTYDKSGTLEQLIVKGQHYDYKLTNNSFKSGIQMVSTYIWQPVGERHQSGRNEKDEAIYETVLSPPKWRGAICIDNMADGSPVGDQFATRALALLNDSHTIKIVNTIKAYITAEPNEYRVDENDM